MPRVATNPIEQRDPRADARALERDVLEGGIEAVAGTLFDNTTFRLWSGRDVSDTERVLWREHARRVIEAAS